MKTAPRAGRGRGGGGSLVLAAGLLVSACATASRSSSAFKPWPSKPPHCDFDVLEEDAEPSRPYDVLGTLSFEGNNWLGAEGRKDALRDTACRAGADVALVSRPFERKLGAQLLRSYDVRFAVYTDVPPPARLESPRAPPPPPPASGTLVVPSSPYSDEVEGTSSSRTR